MKTTVTIDADMVQELMTYYGARTKTAAVNRAVAEQIRLAKLKALSKMLGNIDFDTTASNMSERADLKRMRLLDNLRDGNAD